MLDDKQKIQLIEQYVENLLTAEERLEFEGLLQKDAQLAAEVQFHQKFTNSMNNVGDELFLNNLQHLEQQIQRERAGNPLKKLTDRALKKGGELLNQLADAFLPVPQYENLLAARSRSQSLEVISPENEWNCQNGILQFELKKGNKHPLQLSIEGNRQNILNEQTIAAKTTRFEVDILHLEVGRYYWKLKTSKQLAMGSFFIRKDLMPT